MQFAFLVAKAPSQTLFLEGTAPLRMFAMLFKNGAQSHRSISKSGGSLGGRPRGPQGDG